MIVRAGKRHDGIEKARFLQAKENGIGAKFGPEAAIAKFVVGLARIFFTIGIADFGFFLSAAFEHAENVAWLRDFPAVQRVELGNDALGVGFFGCGVGRRFDRLLLPLVVVALPESRVFCGIAAVVIERGAPEHSRVGHHAGGNGARFGGVTAHRSAGFRSDAKIAWVDEFDVFGGFLEPFGVSALGKIRTILEARVPGLHVGFFFGGVVFGGIRRRARCYGNRRVAAVAVGATEVNGFCRMHGGLVGRSVGGNAADGFAAGFFLGLAAERLSILRGGRSCS